MSGRHPFPHTSHQTPLPPAWSTQVRTWSQRSWGHSLPIWIWIEKNILLSRHTAKDSTPLGHLLDTVPLINPQPPSLSCPSRLCPSLILPHAGVKNSWNYSFLLLPVRSSFPLNLSWKAFLIRLLLLFTSVFFAMCQFLPLSGPPLHIDSQGKLAPWAYCISGFELGGEARTNE